MRLIRSSVSESLSDIKALAAIIQESIGRIEESLLAKDLPFPSPDTQFTPESETARMVPEVLQSINVLVSAAFQLINATRPPAFTMQEVMTSYNLAASFGVAVSAHVPEICREAGPQGIHVNDIAAVTGISPSKLARVLRALATNHIFVEISPDVFANNRNSSIVDTLKSVKDIMANPGEKHAGTMGAAASVGHCTDECMKSAAYMTEAIFNQSFAKTGEPNETALNIAFKTDLSGFVWLETPDNKHRLSRFGITMDAQRSIIPPEATINGNMIGFDWEALGKDALVVDVGGGLGSQSAILARAFKGLKFVVQDREPVIKGAVAFWEREVHGAVESGRVVLQTHDFFEEQPQKNADVFFLRWVMHDWSDKYCLIILKRLRAAAKPTTRLMVVDTLVSYACPEVHVEDIAGAQRPMPPKPLLANMGHASWVGYSTDIQMMNMANGEERTITQFRKLFAEAGWKLVLVHHNDDPSSSKVVAVPI
ncbi:O-methyltransferase [Peniophora sp. CONT]|nr:O-methyltransferase [Peniophora sp. CONT]